MNKVSIAALIAIFCLVPFSATGSNEDMLLVDLHAGATASSKLGWNMTEVGDLANDGARDFAIGAPGLNKVYIWNDEIPKGFTTATAAAGSPDWIITGNSGSDFGWSIAGIGDYNRDGKDDLAVGAPSEGKVYIFSGPAKSTGLTQANAAITINGLSAELFGHSVAGLKFEGGTSVFLAVGSPKNTHQVGSTPYTSGSVFVYNLTDVYNKVITSVSYLQTDLYDGFQVQGDNTNKYLGFTVVNIGDANGDTMEDLGIGDPFQDQIDAVNNGAFYIDYGTILHQPQILAPQCSSWIYGYNNSYFGWSTAFIGDVGSGTEDDIIVGAPLYGSGNVYLFYGIPFTTGNINIKLYLALGTPDITFGGNRTGDRFGTSMCRSDVVSSLDPQIFIGAPGYDNDTWKDAGAVFGFYQPGVGTYAAGTSSTSYIGEQAGDNLGYAVMEVNYTTTQAGRILTSAAFYGPNNAGKLYVLQRNTRPQILALSVSPQTGNKDVEFEFKAVYKDADSDIPRFIQVTIYQDQLGTVPLRTFRMNNTNAPGEQISTGATFSVKTKLPNSVTFGEGDAPHYMKGEAKAIRGSTSIVAFPSTPNLKAGPVVDGVNPSVATEVYTDDGIEEGTFRLSWLWPAEDDFGGAKIQGKVESLAIKVQKDEPIDASNWGDATFYREIRLDAKGPLISDQTIIGAKNDPITNPEDIVLEFRNSSDHSPKNYYVGMRAMDEEGNVGPVVSAGPQEPFWSRPELPNSLDAPTLVDYPNDEGGKLQLTWISSTTLDTEYYWIFIDDEEFTTIRLESGGYRTPDYNISRLKDPYIFYEPSNTSRGLNITDMGGQPLQNGKTYYAAVVPVNWLMVFDPAVKVSPGAKVIDDKADPIPRIKNLIAESTSTPGPGNLSITLRWTPTTDARFVEYQIYAQAYFVNRIEQAILIGKDYTRNNGSFKVTKIAGAPIQPGVEYTFMIVIKDYNDKYERSLVLGENIIYPVRVKDTVTAMMDQVTGVTLRDRDPDGGGVLTLSWNSLIQGGRFWSYNVYFSDEPITSIEGMTPLKRIRDFNTGEIEITNDTADLPLLDGKGYFAAVTIVDWNDLENDLISEENSRGPAEPVNQSDRIAPTGVKGLSLDRDFDPSGSIPNKLKVVWNPVTFVDVPDFNRYIVVYWNENEAALEKEISVRNANSFIIENLRRDTTYDINISIVDDNGNRGTGGIPISGTTGGKGKAPINLTVTITVLLGKEQVPSSNKLNDTEQLEVAIADLFPESDIFFNGIAKDDFTPDNKLIWSWNVTTPDGKYISRQGKEYKDWRIRVADLKAGTYQIKFSVNDTENGESEIMVKLIITAKKDTPDPTGLLLVAVLVVVLIVGIIIAFVVMRSSKSSQEKEMQKQYEDRKKDIDSMEPIYTNLPSWTCSCGSTLVNINKSATCPSCYESFEGLPVDGIDNYLKDHELVLSEMRIGVPLGWRGQKVGIDSAEADLIERKKRAREALDEQFAPFMKKKAVEEKPEGEAPPGAEVPAPVAPITPGVIPGQMPPAQTAPFMGQAPVMGRPQPYQPQPPTMTQYPPK